MTTRMLIERVADFASFSRALAAGRTLPFTPLNLAHIYVKLDFDPAHENARTADDARGFLKSVARASVAASLLAERYGGALLEVQGSMLHAAVPSRGTVVREFAADLHGIYRAVFNDSRRRVRGWRMAADSGRTLVVAGRGVHGDSSFVSLGKAANRPAKHIYAQLELAEERRSLRRYCLGVRDASSDRWQHVELDSLPQRLNEARAIAETARTTDPQMDFLPGLRAQQQRVTARAAPLPPAGAPTTPTADRPITYFGWVMRCDLDGFTSRVEECFDNDAKLQELAEQFYGIMEEAAQFVTRHGELMAQLPWAGDNFTAAVLRDSKDDYDQAIPRRLVELPLDFEKDMADTAKRCGFGGWAHAVAGGEVHGNSNGNVYLGSVILGDRRFLVGVGEGFGRSTQAFADISPKPQVVVVYEPDWARLDDSYKKVFEPAITVRGEQSSLYRVANVVGLLRVRAKRDSIAIPTTVTVAPHRSQQVSTRPYSR
ncbi:MAG: hypothetical protein U1E73_01880 [Planctomycetota bacterium]